MVGMFMGYRVFVDRRAPFRVGHKAIFLTPEEAAKLYSGNRETELAVLNDLEAYELSRAAA